MQPACRVRDSHGPNLANKRLPHLGLTKVVVVAFFVVLWLYGLSPHVETTRSKIVPSVAPRVFSIPCSLTERPASEQEKVKPGNGRAKT